MTNVIYCADGIVRYKGGFVFVQRVAEKGSPFALPGGKQERNADGTPAEPLFTAMLRELEEETGLTGIIVGTLGTYADDGRDPRGQFVSTVFVLDAVGTLRSEVGKTKAVATSRKGVVSQLPLFAFDHAAIMSDYFRLEKQFFT